MRRSWILPQLILGLTFIIAVGLRLRHAVLPILNFQIDLATAILILGVLLASFVLIALLISQRTERIREQARADAVEERRRFLRRLDHELKNPITAIFMGVANLRTADRADDQSLYLENIEAHARRLQRLTSDLRKLADLEQRQFERTEVDLSQLLEETLLFAREAHASQSREFSLVLPDVPWPLPQVRGDRDLLQLAFHNLLENAIKFSDDGDSIEVRASEDGSQVEVVIADTGAGMPAEDLPHVWEELFRGASARGVPGSGLGLALVRAIIERHGGSVLLRSRLGEGTVVTVRLPSA
ncbi:MAG: HAMP domain-containing sensor histidine kinase [Anaerolineales bacterium]|jgi:two-component system OmpR family sensor kinase